MPDGHRTLPLGSTTGCSRVTSQRNQPWGTLPGHDLQRKGGRLAPPGPAVDRSSAAVHGFSGLFGLLRVVKQLLEVTDHGRLRCGPRFRKIATQAVKAKSVVNSP